MIPCGNGARSALGLNLENLQLFVPYQFYVRAVDLHDYFKNDPTEDFKKSLIDLNSYPISFHLEISSSSTSAFVDEVLWSSTIAPGCILGISFLKASSLVGC